MSVRFYDRFSITSTQLIAEYVGPYPDCDHLKKYLCFNLKCKEPECFWVLNDEYYADDDLPLTNEEFMAFKITPAPAQSKTCERYTLEPFILDATNVPAGTTIADLIPLAIGADGGSLEYPSFGAVTATDEVMELRITAEDDNDVILVDTQEAKEVIYMADVDDAETFPGQTPVQVPDGCEMTLTICFRKCLTKAEIALL